ncbi:unnamed protein product [Parascedosporium putredinis]|uniref:Anticodon-binding domain-containing protein n=1 Tax=Parascedosporium putredinis TaxID=1442378 RepID=A0A9P1HBL0_9PEZI|nr:unnamed protein product [Parascedosporium putredinis]CAI8003888.1 unnamed protein product [Parascedosporium putredinis]
MQSLRTLSPRTLFFSSSCCRDSNSTRLARLQHLRPRYFNTANNPTYYAAKFKARTNNTQGKMASTATTLKGQPLDRALLDQTLRRRLFYTPSFEIYNGVAGLYDYGPPGCALQANIIDIWRKHFVIEEDMLEVDCTVLTPDEVLKTSGHVEKFADWMCKDPKNGEIMRADHFVEEEPEAEGDKKKKKKSKGKAEVVKLDDAVVQQYEEILAQIDNYNGEQLGELIVKHDLKNPATGVQPSPPIPFNLMFQTAIGPSGNLQGYLRPETAQGQFLNFAKLLEAGLLRVREFLMAEVEHFVDPEGGKKHERFHEVEHVELVLLDRHVQLSGKTNLTKMTIGDAVKNGVVDNETLGYFLARIFLFMKRIGVDESKLRFRQHMANEMAHYAADCWDCELLTSAGWIECVGCADRSAYDLSVHAKKTGAALYVRERLDEPKIVEEFEVEIDKKQFGPRFKKDAKAVQTALEESNQQEREGFAKTLADSGKITVKVAGVGDGNVEVTSDLVKIERKKRTVNIREYTPNVIEPSFGIGRILYSLMEHSYWTRASDGGDEARSRLRQLGISSKVDASSATIGKRYSRNDELGTPLGVTIDFQTVKDGSLTLRDRDTMVQVRADEDKILEAIKDIVEGNKTWADVENELPKFVGQELEVEVR